MATMDIIKLNGAFPANFPRMWAAARPRKRFHAAFQDSFLARSAVEGILVNHLWRHLEMRTSSRGIVAAARRSTSTCHLVVRLGRAPTSPRASQFLPTKRLADSCPADGSGRCRKEDRCTVKAAAEVLLKPLPFQGGLGVFGGGLSSTR